MLPEKYHWILEQFEPEGDPWLLLSIGRELEKDGEFEGAASVYDRAFGIDPTIQQVRLARKAVLDRLAVFEHGMRFCYIPAGPFLMGSNEGEDDERPLHPVWLSAYWLAETCVSWSGYCQLLGWSEPPNGAPADFNGPQARHESFTLYNQNKIRLQYCEDKTTRAQDWHSHHPATHEQGQAGRAVFRKPPRTEANAPWTYATKPVVAVSWQDGEEVATRLSTKQVQYRLPTEAEWEKAARGGLIRMRYAWGDEPPTEESCDFNRFWEFAIQPMKTYPPNDYGLYAMCGSVWEWTSDWYDREGYRTTKDHDPTGPDQGQEKVLRGGSWADCAEVVGVSYRMSQAATHWRDERPSGSTTPVFGFRLCRVRVE